jgi:hypothetical protein
MAHLDEVWRKTDVPVGETGDLDVVAVDDRVEAELRSVDVPFDHDTTAAAVGGRLSREPNGIVPGVGSHDPSGAHAVDRLHDYRQRHR